jgi:ABC-2 type transport system ATP-binding protein
MPNDKAMAVSVVDLEKRYGSFVAVNRVSFEVRRGEIFGFLGANGAGKSTTIRMLCGIITPTGGSGHVAGYDIIRESESIKQRIGYMSQKFSLYQDLTVDENINFYLGIYGVPRDDREERKEWALRMTQLQDRHEEITGSLPTGFRQRLALGCALLHRPEVVFLDEPTSGVDPITRRGFWDFTRQLATEGTTIFVTTHYMDEAENCQRIAMIFSGRILACNTPAALKREFAGDLPKPSLQDVFVRLMKSSAADQRVAVS